MQRLTSFHFVPTLNTNQIMASIDPSQTLYLTNLNGRITVEGIAILYNFDALLLIRCIFSIVRIEAVPL